MNPVVILTRNCLELTKRCVESIDRQDIPTGLCIFDNGSTDGTAEWAKTVTNRVQPMPFNAGVSVGWNFYLRHLFHYLDVEHVLVCGNDTVLAPWTYSALLSANQHFVTGVDIGMSPLPERPDVLPLSPHPDFSCFLIRRYCWDVVGPFDERMVSYASDCSYHVEAHRLGVPLWKASVPYNHERSSTMNRATPQERHAIQEQANRDRATFKSIYGCLPGTAEYNNLFREPSGQIKA